MVLATVLIILPALPTLLIVLAGVSMTDQLLGCSGVAVAFLVGLSPMGTYVAWQYHPAAGCVYFVVTYAASLMFTARLSEYWAGSTKVFAVTLGVWALSVGWLFTFHVLPRIEVPQAAADLLQPKPISQGADLTHIKASVARIQTSINRAAGDIQREQSNIESATKELLEDLDRRGKTIRRLQDERDRLAKQIQQERAIATLTTHQAEAIRLSLSRGRYFEYLIGFLIGIASSLTATVVARVLRGAP